MDNPENLSPSNYVGPRGALEQALCNGICRLMISTEKIAVSRNSDAKNLDDTEFVLALPPFWTLLRILVNPSYWVGESFAEGAWYLRKGKLADFLLTIRQDAPRVFRRYYEFTAGLKGVRHYLGQHLLNKYYTRKVREHYEVDPKIYELILDREMVYTCALFERVDQSLENAQQHKLSLAIMRLDLPQTAVKVLDVGCGWGATTRAIVRSNELATVCGLSLSENQIAWARAHDDSTLSADQCGRIEYRVEDYIDHREREQYDAVIVIGMIEHVGLGGYDAFFAKLHDFLKPGGTVVVHSIVSPASDSPTNRWIDKHIFSGGYAPSVAELVKAMEAQPFQLTALHLHKPNNYRQTIECWLANFISNMGRIASYLRQQGDSDLAIEQFVRTWLFYLSAVRNMFSDDDARSHQVIQACIRKR